MIIQTVWDGDAYLRPFYNTWKDDRVFTCHTPSCYFIRINQDYWIVPYFRGISIFTTIVTIVKSRKDVQAVFIMFNLKKYPGVGVKIYNALA